MYLSDVKCSTCILNLPWSWRWCKSYSTSLMSTSLKPSSKPHGRHHNVCHRLYGHISIVIYHPMSNLYAYVKVILFHWYIRTYEFPGRLYIVVDPCEDSSLETARMLYPFCNYDCSTNRLIVDIISSDAAEYL